MALKFEIDKLEDVDAGMRSHYVKTDSGKFRLALNGEPPDSAKVAEFRGNNIKLTDSNDKLTQEVERLRLIAGAFDGIDPVKAKEAITKLPEVEATLATEKAANAEAQKRATRSILRDTLRTKLLAAGVLPAAVDIALDKADPVFAVVNDTVKAKPNMFSKTRPGEPLTPDDWIADTVREFPFLFGPTVGGGGSGSGSKNSSTANELRDPDARQLGEHAADIASGKMRVVTGGQ